MAGHVAFSAGAGAIVMLQLAVAFTGCPSTTFAVKLIMPEVVGVPVIAPVDVFSVRPSGSEPTVE